LLQLSRLDAPKLLEQVVGRREAEQQRIRRELVRLAVGRVELEELVPPLLIDDQADLRQGSDEAHSAIPRQRFTSSLH
jgi:hypothetical protein